MPGKIFSTLSCQNQTSLCRKLRVAYVCQTARSAASTRVKGGANWEDFDELLVNVLRNFAPVVLGRKKAPRVSSTQGVSTNRCFHKQTPQ